MGVVITFRHRIVSINVELFTVVLRRLQQNVQVRGGICLRREPQSHRRPTVLVLKKIESLFAQVVVDVYPLWVTGVCHAVVTNEDNVDDFGEVPSLQSVLEILCEEVNSLQRILFYP